MKVLADEFVLPARPMESGRGLAEDEARLYHKVEDARGRVWLYPNNYPNPGDWVYMDDPRDTDSDGFGGSTLEFRLAGGRVYVAKGPWHSSSNALRGATGIDLTERHMTLVVVGLGVVRGSTRPGVTEVIYQDQYPVIGPFNRGAGIAKDIANELGRTVQLLSASSGGSSRRSVDPD